MRTDPDGGLVRPEGLLLIDPAEEILLDGIPRAKEGKKNKNKCESNTKPCACSCSQE